MSSRASLSRPALYKPSLAMKIDILTLFPNMFGFVLEESMVKKAQDRGAVSIRTVDIRDFSEDKHRKVDDKPYGGGAGMVIKPEPVFKCLEHVLGVDRIDPGDSSFKENRRIVLFTPQGRLLDQKSAEDFAESSRLILICGHYEGFDERVRTLATDEVSIGDYVLTCGELPAMVFLDSVIRLLPGALGDESSASEDSFSTGLLEYPHYTRPAEFRGMRVPEVLLSGDHKSIEEWRRKQSLAKTEEFRPDLLKRRIDLD